MRVEEIKSCYGIKGLYNIKVIDMHKPINIRLSEVDLKIISDYYIKHCKL